MPGRHGFLQPDIAIRFFVELAVNGCANTWSCGGINQILWKIGAKHELRKSQKALD